MDFGLALPNYRDGSSREGLEAAVDAAERLGFSIVWTTDHVLVEEASRVEYGRIFDGILTLAYLAARSSTVKLGTSVVVVPQRAAVVVAKQLATLDVLSQGRLIAGVGIGWNRIEFENLDEVGQVMEPALERLARSLDRRRRPLRPRAAPCRAERRRVSLLVGGAIRGPWPAPGRSGRSRRGRSPDALGLRSRSNGARPEAQRWLRGCRHA